MANKFNLNKKAIAFPLLISLFLIVLYGLILLLGISPIEDVKKDVDFGNMVVEVDRMIMLKPAEDFYKSFQINKVIVSSQNNFVNNIQSSNLGFNQGLTDPEKNIICKLNKGEEEVLSIWYNEIANDESTSDKEYDNCLPVIVDIDEKYSNFLEENLDESLNPLDMNYDTQIGITQLDEEGNFEVEFENNIQTSGQYFESELSTTQTRDVNLGSYSQLVEVLLKIIPNLSKEFQERVPVCVNEKELDQKECMGEVFEDLVELDNFLVGNDYDIELEFIDDIKEDSQGKYYGLDVSFVDVDKETVSLNFGLILKDTIPYLPLQFEVKASDELNNFVEVLIDKPNFNEEVSGYMVMYSYEDFLSTSHPKNKEFIELLKSGKVPGDLQPKSLQLLDSASNKYFYSDELDLTVMFSSKKGFETIQGDEKSIKTVKIYQIYNLETKKFELLKNPIYVYAFALDVNNNLFVDDIENNAKFGGLVSVNGPIPPLKDKVSLVGEMIGYEKTLSLSVKEYSDSSFDHFDIYILDEPLKDGNKLERNCEGLNGCYYFDGWGVLSKDKFTESGLFNFIITSMDNVDFANTVYTNQFSPNFLLENGKTYNVYVIAQDNDNIGAMSNFNSKSFEVKDSQLNFQSLSSNILQHPILYFSNIKIVDKKAPEVEDIEFLNPNFKVENNYLYLQWKPKIENDIKELKAMMQIKKIDGTSTSSEVVTIGLDGKVTPWGSNYNRVVLDNIYPVDFAGNANLLTPTILTKSYPSIATE